MAVYCPEPSGATVTAVLEAAPVVEELEATVDDAEAADDEGPVEDEETVEDA